MIHYGGETLDPSPLDTVVAVLPTPFLDDGGLDSAASNASSVGRSRAACVPSRSRATPGSSARCRRDEIGRLIDVAAATLAGRAALLVGVGGDLRTARQMAAKAAVRRSVRGDGPRAGWTLPIARGVASATTPSSRPPCPGWRSSRTFATRPSGRMTSGRSSRRRPRVVAVKYAVPDPVRFADIVTNGPEAALDLWARGVVGAVLPARRRDRVHVRAGLIEPRLSLDAARAPARRDRAAEALDELAARPSVRGAAGAERRCGECPGDQGSARAADRSSGAPSGRRSRSSDPRTARRSAGSWPRGMTRSGAPVA